MAQLSCPTCGTPFAAANVNVALGVASCASCGQVHDLADQAARAARRTPVDPNGFELVEGATPEVSWSWRAWGTLAFLILWCVIWDGVLVVMVGAALGSGEFEALTFGSLHILVGIGMTYFTVAAAVNRTAVRIEGETLTVTHGPLPWFGDKGVATADIRQVYVVEDRGSKGSRSYSVHVQVAPGHPIKLVHGMPTAPRARFLEDWIERRLDLVDAPVSGEHA